MFYKTIYELTAKDEVTAITLMENLNEYLSNTLNKGNKFKTCSTEEQEKHLCSSYQVNYTPDINTNYSIKIRHDKNTLQCLYIIKLKDGVLYVLSTRNKTNINIALKHVYSVDPYFKKTKTFNNTKQCIRDFLNIKTALTEEADRPFIIKSVEVSTDYEHGLIDLVEL